MKPKHFLQLLFLAAGYAGSGQYQNLSFSPEQPKPGNQLMFEYATAGTVLGEVNDFEAIAYLQDGAVRAQEIDVKKNGDKWTGTITTNDSTKAVLLV